MRPIYKEHLAKVPNIEYDFSMGQIIWSHAAIDLLFKVWEQ